MAHEVLPLYPITVGFASAKLIFGDVSFKKAFELVVWFFHFFQYSYIQMATSSEQFSLPQYPGFSEFCVYIAGA
jgi:hypothetical protein